MTYRSLLLMLDREERCRVRTAIAIELARRLECSLTGLAATGVVVMPPAVGAASFGDAATVAWDALRAQATASCNAFAAACRSASFEAYETRLEQDDPTTAFVRHAAYHDLGIVGQAAPEAPGTARETVEQIVLQSPRPTLLIPYAGSFPTIGNNVLVAWDASRQAARAVADALPLLRRARKISACAWTEVDDPETMRRPDFDSLLLWLRRHGIEAQARRDVAQIPIAEAMLSQAADWGVDLIVMGAYGHGRWRERVFGGATRGLLSSMTVPVLMSH